MASVIGVTPGIVRGHGVEVALLAGGDGVVLDRLLRAAEVGLVVVPADATTLRDGAHRIEHRHALELRVGDEDVLVGGALHLEAAGRVADGGEVDEVVALAAGEGDREAAVPVGARGAIDAAGHGGGSHGRVLDRLRLGVDDLSPNDVELLGDDGARKEDKEDERGEQRSAGSDGTRWGGESVVGRAVQPACTVRHARPEKGARRSASEAGQDATNGHRMVAVCAPIGPVRLSALGRYFSRARTTCTPAWSRTPR